jgi:hypothetical protein
VTFSPAIVRRLEVMRLRIRLEQAAAAAFDVACGAPSDRMGRQLRVDQRLLFLLASLDPDGQAEAHRTVRLARHVYQRTSDVLHGRLEGLSVPAAVLAEWSAVVDRVEELRPKEEG